MQKIVCEIRHRGERIGEAAHPGLPFLNFVRIPGLSGSDTGDIDEDVPSTVVSTIAPTGEEAHSP